MNNYLIKVYHSYDKGKSHLENFLKDIGKTLEGQSFTLSLNYRKGEFFYGVNISDKNISSFESHFYNFFGNFQIENDSKDFLDFDKEKSVIGELSLVHSSYFPFKLTDSDNTDFISSLYRTFENLNITRDKVGYFIELKPIKTEGSSFFLRVKLSLILFKIKLALRFYKYILNVKGQKDWKKIGYEYFKKKIEGDLYEAKIYLVVESKDKQEATNKLKEVFNKFLFFKNYPLNQFELKIKETPKSTILLNPEEISNLISFPKNPKNETGLLKVNSKKLALPIGIPIFDFTLSKEEEIIPINVPPSINILGISDYRSIKVPVGIYDDDRLRHIYAIGKTGVGKSKFLISTIINDIKQGKGLAVIDPHGDLIEEIYAHIPESRFDDVIIFDPTYEDYPFCLNPLQVGENESKQILSKGFIDIFKKFFGANWNAKLEHVLRMTFLALLDKKDSTLFDIIRALTDKDFRYEMISEIQDDVVKNFWTNEFASWSGQFNTEAIMPILNKVGQLLSVEMLKNIFTSKENKLDFRNAMDTSKILLIKLPKGKLQEEIMGFLGAMFVTKIYQAAMGRQNQKIQERVPFFLYVDEFQNFATDTFGEILSEARKYSLGLIVAHQFIKQIPENITRALFGNVGTIISFRISSEDSLYMKEHFEPFLDTYDLANINQMTFYCKTIVKGQVKDPFSIKSVYIKTKSPSKELIEKLYTLSRTKYSRSLIEAKKKIEKEDKDIVEKLESFREPLI